MMKLRLITASAAGIVVVLLSPETAVGSPILAPPEFLVGSQGVCVAPLECPPLHFGSLELIDFTDQFSSVDVKAENSIAGPVARVDGQIQNIRSNAAVVYILEAQVNYEVAVVPVGPGLGLPVPSVPVEIMANVLARADDRTGGFANASVNVFGGAFLRTGIVVCVALVCANSASGRITGFASPDSPLSISLDAVAGAGVDEQGAIAQFQAFADPIVSIADGMIPGTNINFRDAFAIEISPGVTQSRSPADVPEPATFVLLGAALLALRFAGWRRVLLFRALERCHGKPNIR